MIRMEASQRPPSVFLTVARREIVLLWRERSLPIVVVLLSALLVGGVANGVLRIDERDALLSRLTGEQSKRFEALAAQIGSAEASREPTPVASPTALVTNPGSQYAMMPTAPLAPLALGQSDLLPNHLQVVGQSEASFLYESDIENPWHLSAGHFDVAFVVVFLLPLLVFGLGYNLLSAEREQGTLRLLLAQPVSPIAVTLGKAAARAAVLAAPLFVVPLSALLLFRPVEDRNEFFIAYGLWSALALGYGLFWLALAILVNTLGKSSAFNAMALVGAWLVLTLAAPVALNLVVDASYPTPSRTIMVEMLNRAMDEAARHSADLDRTDYDTLRDPTPKDGKAVLQPTLLRALKMHQEISETMRPWVRNYETRAAERRDFVDAFRIVSPAAIAFEGMSDIAGTSFDRYSRLQHAAAEFYRDKMGRALPRISTRTLLTEAEFRTAPRFVWTEDRIAETVSRGASSLMQLLVPTALISAWGLLRLRRLSI
ncbi:MAG: ABC transporter permease [Methylocystaceae bacterium]|nr:MAG: ABC transporter permease [Methylocystaceae bacterium]